MNGRYTVIVVVVVDGGSSGGGNGGTGGDGGYSMYNEHTNSMSIYLYNHVHVKMT